MQKKELLRSFLEGALLDKQETSMWQHMTMLSDTAPSRP
jgi:hypothetical protein